METIINSLNGVKQPPKEPPIGIYNALDGVVEVFPEIETPELMLDLKEIGAEVLVFELI